MVVVPPKRETGTHHAQRYTITFDPNAPEYEQWVWQVDFVHVRKFFGACATSRTARSQAFRRIMFMIETTIASKESE
jgi:hypothetical protein